jgi:hypothetical protein
VACAAERQETLQRVPESFPVGGPTQVSRIVAGLALTAAQPGTRVLVARETGRRPYKCRGCGGISAARGLGAQQAGRAADSGE